MSTKPGDWSYDTDPDRYHWHCLYCGEYFELSDDRCYRIDPHKGGEGPACEYPPDIGPFLCPYDNESLELDKRPEDWWEQDFEQPFLTVLENWESVTTA